MDVRMGGEGRPFVLEAANPRGAVPSDAQLAAATAALHAGGRVGVRCLSVITRAQRESLRDGETEKSKAYRAVVALSRDVTAADVAALTGMGANAFMIAQQTPVRVLHRRAALTREREIQGLNVSLISGHPRAFILELRCGAGTYVKEFIHGDWGRTAPALPDLLAPGAPPATADCLQLDVTAVEMDWL
jgi:tRNA pseudouridine synthase 10